MAPSAALAQAEIRPSTPSRDKLESRIATQTVKTQQIIQIFRSNAGYRIQGGLIHIMDLVEADLTI